MVSGSFSTGSASCQSPFGASPSNLWKKQEWRPVWQAMPPACSTFSSTTSSSQSSRISSTFCTWPDSSPLCHSFLRERLQYTASPSSTVLYSASRFIQANISTSLLPASWAITGTRPCSSHFTRFSHFALATLGVVVGILIGLSCSSQPHRNALLRHEALGFLHGVLAIVEDAGRQHRVRAALDDAVGQVLQAAHAARGDHGHADGIGHGARQFQVEAGLGAVAVHAGQQQL